MYDGNRALLAAGVFLIEMQLSVVRTFNNMHFIGVMLQEKWNMFMLA